MVALSKCIELRSALGGQRERREIELVLDAHAQTTAAGSTLLVISLSLLISCICISKTNKTNKTQRTKSELKLGLDFDDLDSGEVSYLQIVGLVSRLFRVIQNVRCSISV